MAGTSDSLLWPYPGDFNVATFLLIFTIITPLFYFVNGKLFFV